ncbi:histidine kinase [Lutibacter sp. HS1-25]|uniref:sensor histidine kinase n=1 Tax=Lutibacter sp. HS1-25 TaxID=2485000 RepID=UPI0010122C35|nr:ATP-binding protein [Lutibacter sp. HS1-25]RXP64414.1 histidine kinase [Lutibacter sp. HS1-25]
MEQTEIQLLVFVTTIIVLILAITLIVFFFYFQQKKTAYLLKQRETQLLFEEEITKSKLEIQEQALQNISWEIHDNVGQLLSTAKMQLNMMQFTLPEDQQEGIQETSNIIGRSLEDLRGLAKSLNPETIKNKGLITSLKQEVERYNRLNFINAKLEISEDFFDLSNEKEIILFRILQEFCNNTLKYSKAKELIVNLNYENDVLNITASDNGIGFDTNDKTKQNGIGLINIKSRGELIGAKIDLKSAQNKGTMLYISCPK